MRTIKNIIVPTDFSATARNAFNYAQFLAEALNADITVVHIKEYALPASEIVVMPHIDEEDSVRDAMDAFINLPDENAPPLVKTNIKTQILRGSSIDELVAYSAKSEADLMVMGTTGLQDFLSKIMGTVSLDVANKAHCPLLLVPRDATWQPINRILFAANYNSTTPKTVNEIIDFAQLLGTNIHFVHVNENKTDDKKLMETIWNELFIAPDPRVPFEMYTIYEGDVVEQLKKHAVEHHIDLIAFVNKKRSFWQNLMHSSVTQNMAISTDKPILVLHFDD